MLLCVAVLSQFKVKLNIGMIASHIRLEISVA